ncbi:MAG: hybrid sensor histidine kinase/response regulator [Deltaproteobacteria bacterium]|nr:MAG: hybrid sensor histidine kinase/response regulator [Deltaproteobacteria bacterium]
MLTKPNILVVENNIAVLNKVNQLLTSRGYNVIAVERAIEAFDIIQRKPRGIDIMLLSLELPRLGAMPLLETLRKARSEILILAMSADCGEEAIEAMHAGAYDCIRKAFTTERFWTKMDRAIERFHLKRELETLQRESRSIQGPWSDSMRAILDSMADGILVSDLHGNLVFCNSTAAGMFDVACDEVGRPFQQFIRNKELEKLLGNAAGREPDTRTGHHEVCLLETGDKRLRIHISPVISRDGVPVGTVALIHDVMHISGMDSLRDDFIFMVSHQLKSPLSSMLMQLSVVVDGLAGDLNAKQKDLLTKTKEKTKSMITLVNDLLDFRRIEEGKVLQEIERLDLKEILQRTMEMMAVSAEEREISVTTHVSEDLPCIIGDRNAIEAIFVNLISNAVKYTPTGGRVTVDLYKGGDDVRIKVVDTGIGIAQSDINRIFDKFYRIRSETTKNIAGSGLGLSIVKRIVDLHKGTVYVESEENKGSTFIVSLPISR